MMFDRLESESQINVDQATVQAPSGAQTPAVSQDEDEPTTDVLPQHVRALIERCMAGTEPPGRELRVGEVQKFAPQHIQMVLMRSAGMRLVEIADLLDVTPVTVGNVVRHPYGRKIIYEMMHRQGSQIIDIRKRLEIYAGEMLDHTLGLALSCEDVEAASKVTFGLLDRAGYAPKAAVSSGERKSGLDTDNSALSRLATALDESYAADRVASSFRQLPAPDAGRADILADASSVGSVAPSRGDRLASVSGQRLDRDAALDGPISDDPSVVAVINGHTIRKAAHG